MLNVGNINKNVEMLKNVDTKLNFLTQIIFFFNKEFKKIIINPKFYQHLFSALLISIPLHSAARWEAWEVFITDCTK